MKRLNIAVHVDMKGGVICASRLSLSDSFICTGADAQLKEWISLYLEGKAPALSLLSGPPFQREVMKALAAIPFGQTISYQELASQCGCPRGARAVGNACGKNPFPLFIPCHRVIKSDGTIGGFAVDSEIKRRLLEFEAGASCPG